MGQEKIGNRLKTRMTEKKKGNFTQEIKKGKTRKQKSCEIKGFG